MKGLHGSADLLVFDLLKECEGGAMRPGTVLFGDDEGMEARVAAVAPGTEDQTLGMTQLKNTNKQN